MRKKHSMQKTKTYLVLAVSLILIVAVSVPPTFSWLSSQSKRVVNTFAGGAISIILDEAPVNPDGQEIPGDRVTENSYKYTAGAELHKDPTPTVLKGSDESYVFLCVENNLSDKFTMDFNTTAWKKVAVSESLSLYVYNAKVDASDDDAVLEPIFTTVTVSDDLTTADIEALGERTLRNSLCCADERTYLCGGH